jgi:hypothetical protein
MDKLSKKEKQEILRFPKVLAIVVAALLTMCLNLAATILQVGRGSLPPCALASWSCLVEGDGFIERMAAGRTTLSKTDIIAVFQLAREELTRPLAEGCYVKTPLGSALPGATGKMSGAGDPFPPRRPGSGHALRFEFRVDREIEDEAIRSIQCVRDREGDRRLTKPLNVEAIPPSDCGGLKAGGLARLSGSRMKFDSRDSRLGLFFEDENGRETRSALYVQVLPASMIGRA